MMPSWPQLLILIAVIVLLFGTKKLRNLGSDLGASIKGFKKSMNEDDKKDDASQDADFDSQHAADTTVDKKAGSVEANSQTDNKKE